MGGSFAKRKCNRLGKLTQVEQSYSNINREIVVTVFFVKEDLTYVEVTTQSQRQLELKNVH